MQTFRDSVSIRGAPHALPELAPFINRLLTVLDSYPEEVHQLVNLILVEPDDSLEVVTDALGFGLEDHAVEHIDVHAGYWELTYVLNDDGFGLVVYVPDRQDIAPQVLQFCREQAVTGRP